MRIVAGVLGALIAIMGIASPAQAQISATFGGGVSTGDYGSTRDTTMANASVGLRWTDGSTTIAASLPYVVIRSPGVVFTGFDGTPLVMLPDAGGPRRERDGIGDPTFSLSHDVPLGSLSLRGTARVKVPVQGYNDISTGKLDWSVSGEISREMGPVTPFVTLGYRHFGDPVGWSIQDGLAGSAGVSVKAGPGALAVSYEIAHSTSRFVDDAQEIVAAYDVPVGRRLRVAAYGDVGLSDGAPKLGAGLRISVPL